MANTPNTIIAIVARLGWRTSPIKAGFLVYPPDGSRPIAIHTSQRRDYRYTRNAIAQLRRAGADI